MRLFIFILFILFSLPSFAITLKEIGEEASVPVTTDAKYVLMAGAALTGILLIFEDSVSDPFQEKQVRNKTLGSSSHYGDMLGQLIPNVMYVGTMGALGLLDQPKAYDRAIGMFKATLYSSTVTNVLKYTVREPRPYSRTTLTSFPSGHTTTAFAFSGFVAAEHGWAWGVPAVLMSTFVGYSRINDNAHYLHDVVAGATIGWVYGWGMSKHMATKKKEETQTYFSPVIDSKTIGVGLFRTF